MSHLSTRISTAVDRLREVSATLPPPPTTKQRMWSMINTMRKMAKEDKRKRVYRRVEIDWEAYIRRSELDKTPRMPPLKAARVFTDYFNRPNYEWHRDCSRCERDERAPMTVRSIRPPGTLSRWSCHGCAVSFLDELGEELGAVRDRLYGEWIDAREDLKDHQAGRKYQDTEHEKKRWRRRRDRLQNQISEARTACVMAGVNPEARNRKYSKRKGGFPEDVLDPTLNSMTFDPETRSPIQAESVDR